MTSQSWGNATAVNTAHAANLTFSYQIKNVGTDYARILQDLAFSIFLGDNPNPIYTYYPANDFGGDGALHNLEPGASRGSFNAHPVPLTLDQMRAIDLGQPLRIVLVNYSFGEDQIFYQDALSSDVEFIYARQFPDGERFESVLVPIVPNGQAPETVQTVMQRFFPTQTDANGNLVSIATPNVDSGVLTFDVHAQSAVSWWNIYLGGTPTGIYDMQDMIVYPNPVTPYTVLMRFGQDSDHDGYSDVSERRLGTDPTSQTHIPSLNCLRACTASAPEPR